jgi:hypothetical protein
MGVDLPTGLRGAYEQLSMNGDRNALERLTSLVWLRLVADPDAPPIAGHHPGTIVEPKIEWPLPADGRLLDAGSAVLNQMLGEELLSTDWRQLRPAVLERVVAEVCRWQPHEQFGPDYLGEISQRVRSDAAKSARGEYYTPYNVSLMMAMMTGVGPGDRVLDPACGSGRMLLAALEVCRRNHPGELPEVFGIDISPDAVRLCRLNLALAGIHPAHRVELANFLTMSPPEQLSPIQQAMQIALFQYEAGETVGWRQRDVA